MKTNLQRVFLQKAACILLASFSVANMNAQNATASTPMGIGKDCNTTKDSFRVLRYNPSTNQLASISTCKPVLGGGSPSGPSFSSGAGSVAYNPANQNVYYIATTTGNNSFVYNWRPDTCHITSSPKQVYSQYYPTQFVVGLDFNPTVANEGYQLEFTGSTAPYNTFLRKVNFSTSYFGPSEPITFSAGKKIYVQNGDIIFTPAADLYVAFNNKIFKIDYSTYGTGAVNGTYIDTLNFGAGGYNLTGIAYVAKGTFIGSLQNSSSSACKFVEIDISSGSAVITPVTLPLNNFTATDMATMISGLGVAKKVSGLTSLGSNNWRVTYDVKVKNYGNALLQNVQVKDSVAKVFGSVFTSASVAAVGSLPPGLTINPLYNGNTNCNIFVGGAASLLRASPSDSATVRVTVVLSNPDINATYNNTALGSAECKLFPSITVSDSSNNSGALRADLNNNGVPDESNEDVPTPLKINGWSVLPITLSDFNGSWTKDKSMLSWVLTNSAEQVDVVVQRSTDAVHFEDIGTRQSKAQTSGRYTWEDVPQIAGVYYYRVKIGTAEAEVIYSDIVKIITEIKAFTDFTVAPNPFTSSVHFSFTMNYNDLVSYRLYDNSMRLVKSGKYFCKTGENNLSIDNLENVPAGIYLLQATTNGKTFSIRLMKR